MVPPLVREQVWGQGPVVLAVAQQAMEKVLALVLEEVVAEAMVLALALQVTVEVQPLVVGANHPMEAKEKVEFVEFCSSSDVAYTHLYIDWRRFYP